MRHLQGSGAEADYAELRRVADWCEANDVEADKYGEADGLQAFEERVAEMLGYPAARFMPSGTMAQQIALRIWSDGHEQAAARGVVGLHPTSHLLLHEQMGYDRLHALTAVQVGEASRPMTTDDVLAVADPLAALIVELPTRENGGQLTAWSDLVALTSAARGRGTVVHLDGARLWEAAAGYGRPLDEICALFDSAYVSFYKGIGALPGSMLAGSTGFVAQSAVWQRRQGGNLYSQMANWVSADMRLDAQIAKMSTYKQRAVEIAAALTELDGIMLTPRVPQVNMFHAFVRGEKEDLLSRRDQVAEVHDLRLFGGVTATDVPGMWELEFSIGDAALALEIDEIVAAFETFLAE